MYVLETDRETAFFEALARGRELFVPERLPETAVAADPERPAAAPEGVYRLARADRWDPARHAPAPYRPVEPLKSVVFPPRVRVDDGDRDEGAPPRERIVIGVKNCDLSALRVHDAVFLQTEPVDPFYAGARRRTLLVSCDCSSALDVCFCTAVGEQPHPLRGYDLNLSPVAAGWVVDAGSPRGETLVREHGALLRPADAASLAERDSRRAAMAERVREQAGRAGLAPGLDFRTAVRETAESGLWGEFAERCVECGACNFACCTCHCFLLADGLDPSGAPARARQWDACLYRDFARVAGGANPRRHRAERLYNRFDKKFQFFPDVFGFTACDGCGRCVEACTGRIDIREVLRRAVDERESLPAGAGNG